MRHIGWDIDEVACSGFTAEFEMVSPSHASSAANDVKDCLQFARVMRSGLGIRLDYDRAGPQFARACSGVCNCGGPCYTRSLGRVGVQVACWNDSDAVVLPVHDLHDSPSCSGLQTEA
jgi:hypothetical protein